MRDWIPTPLAGALLLAAATAAPADDGAEGRRWLAGDHHVHSRYSVGWNPPYQEWISQLAGVQEETGSEPAPEPQPAPEPVIGGDAIYPIPMNALAGKYFGLDWIVTTDHGGPNHSKINLEKAYPELEMSRRMVPEVVQFYGIELNPPGADHASIIVPHGHDEAQHLHAIESRFDRLESWPLVPEADQPARTLEALRFMDGLEDKPVVIAHHPARSAAGMSEYGHTTPAELRDWNDLAPEVAVGMEGAPGHQAAALAADGSPTRGWPRGFYNAYPTMGGFDQMTARLGGFWDSMLAEGRHWWITANSDSHVHYTEGGGDFWPGEYCKTWVWGRKNHDDILDGLRTGRVFVATGDLVTELHLSVGNASAEAGMGGHLRVPAGSPVNIEIRFLDPETINHRGENPQVSRVDLIVGAVTGPLESRETDTHPGTLTVERFGPDAWGTKDGYRVIEHTIKAVDSPFYVRLRGTNTDQLEPQPDLPSDDPWHDLWFYSNPVFVTPFTR